MCFFVLQKLQVCGKRAERQSPVKHEILLGTDLVSVAQHMPVFMHTWLPLITTCYLFPYIRYNKSRTQTPLIKNKQRIDIQNTVWALWFYSTLNTCLLGTYLL